jgi:hypothetical protein
MQQRHALWIERLSGLLLEWVGTLATSPSAHAIASASAAVHRNDPGRDSVACPTSWSGMPSPSQRS